MLASKGQLRRSYTIDETAALLGISRRTVYYRVKSGLLKTIRTIGGSQRVTVESIEASGAKIVAGQSNGVTPDA